MVSECLRYFPTGWPGLRAQVEAALFECPALLTGALERDPAAAAAVPGQGSEGHAVVTALVTEYRQLLCGVLRETRWQAHKHAIAAREAIATNVL